MSLRPFLSVSNSFDVSFEVLFNIITSAKKLTYKQCQRLVKQQITFFTTPSLSDTYSCSETFNLQSGKFLVGSLMFTKTNNTECQMN